MAEVVLHSRMTLMWTCEICGVQYPIDGPETDPSNLQVAIDHGNACGSDMAPGASPAWIECEVIADHGSGG